MKIPFAFFTTIRKYNFVGPFHSSLRPREPMTEPRMLEPKDIPLYESFGIVLNQYLFNCLFVLFIKFEMF